MKRKTPYMIGATATVLILIFALLLSQILFSRIGRSYNNGLANTPALLASDFSSTLSIANKLDMLSSSNSHQNSVNQVPSVIQSSTDQEEFQKLMPVVVRQLDLLFGTSFADCQAESLSLKLNNAAPYNVVDTKKQSSYFSVWKVSCSNDIIWIDLTIDMETELIYELSARLLDGGEALGIEGPWEEGFPEPFTAYQWMDYLGYFDEKEYTIEEKYNDFPLTQYIRLKNQDFSYVISIGPNMLQIGFAQL